MAILSFFGAIFCQFLPNLANLGPISSIFSSMFLCLLLPFLLVFLPYFLFPAIYRIISWILNCAIFMTFYLQVSFDHWRNISSNPNLFCQFRNQSMFWPFLIYFRSIFEVSLFCFWRFNGRLPLFNEFWMRIF